MKIEEQDDQTDGIEFKILNLSSSEPAQEKVDDQVVIDDQVFLMTVPVLASTIHKTGEQVFKPAREHGYHNQELNQLIEDCGIDKDGYSRGKNIIGMLEDMFVQILENLV